MTAYLKGLISGLIAILTFLSPSLAQVTFIQHTIDDNFGGPAGVYACDLDGDGDQDVIGAAIDDNEVAWWRNDGGDPIVWTKQTIDGAFLGAAFVHAADVDGDELIDVLGAAWYGHEIAWWRNDGGDPINWTKQTIDAGFTNAHEVYATDLDGDGDTDVLGAGAGNNTITWWRNDGGDPIEWTEQVIGSNFYGSRSVFPDDFDGDQDKDVVGAALTSGEVTWWRNDGGDPIEWTEFTISNTFSGSHMVRTCDVDKDGDPDVLGAAYMARDIAWWSNDGGDPIEWTQQIIDGNFVGAVTVCPADIDGDGEPDVVGAAQEASDLAWWHNGGGDPIDWSREMINYNFGGAWPAFATDLNGDERIDVIAGGNSANEIRWWENSAPTGIGDEADLDERQPRITHLSQNQPNPFNPSTTIRYELTRSSKVLLKVYTVRGQEVRTLVDARQNPNSYQVVWDGRDDNGQTLGSGIYFYRLEVGNRIEIKRMVLAE